MKNIIAVIVSLFVVSAVSAQKARFEIKFTADASDVQKVYIQPCDDSDTATLRLKGDVYSGMALKSGSGFYNLIALKGHSQVILPIYVGDKDKINLEIEAQGKEFFLSDSPENKSLSALARSINIFDRRLWLEENMSGEQLKNFVTGYQIALDSIVAANDITGPVAEFMTVYAYTHAYNAYSNIPRTQKIPVTSIPFSRNEVLPPITVAFDNEYAPMFFTAIQMIRDDLSSSPVLLDKLSSLYKNYKNEDVRKRVSEVLVNDFITHYRYNENFEGGLEIVKKATEEFSLSDNFVKEFLKRKATIPGSLFPENITLVDANGKVVDFSEFRGKYVYIDMWASWCAPCCKEVPHRQKLEAELQNKDVVFVSVSCDADELAWKNRMKELNVHGVQLLDKDNALGDALNVKAIPFFVIYDKEGYLHTYGAMRPSSGDAIKQLLEGLK